LKAELAGRLLASGAEAEAEAAAKEIRELEQVARGALTEVREAVSGYRELTLAGELAGARAALAAAGIAASVEHPELALEPEVESVLAWAVREGTTNVIRHSGARHCTLRIVGTAEGAELEVIDDGRGVGESVAAPGVPGRTVGAGVVGAGPAGVAGAGAGGHGLRGLAERAEALAGTVQAGRRGEGGYRLAVRVPSAGQLLGPEIAAS
jgi:two-component system sensor histidine kinase DesK